MSGLLGPVDPAGLEPSLADLLARLPDLPHFRLLAHAPTAFSPRLAYGRVLMHELSLQPAVHEAVVLRVAGWSGCDYVRTQHEPAAARAGMTAGQLAAAASGNTELLPDEAVRAVVDLVSVVLDRSGPAPAAVDRVVALVGGRGLVEVCLLVERYLGLSLTLVALGIPAVDTVDLHDPGPATGR